MFKKKNTEKKADLNKDIEEIPISNSNNRTSKQPKSELQGQIA